MARVRLERLKSLAKSNGLDSAKLARKADLGQTTVHKIWIGETKDPGIRTMSAIAKALGVRVSELIDEENIVDLDRMSVLQ